MYEMTFLRAVEAKLLTSVTMAMKTFLSLRQKELHKSTVLELISSCFPERTDEGLCILELKN